MHAELPPELAHADLARVRDQLERGQRPIHGLQRSPWLVAHLATPASGNRCIVVRRSSRSRIVRCAQRISTLPDPSRSARLRRGGPMEEPQRYWRNAEPKDAYEVVIVGGGGHGLATAYYLAKNHGITDVCIVEKGWLAGGNVARNTTVIRSNYLWDASAAIYEHSLKLWEGLEEDLDMGPPVRPEGRAQRPAPHRRGAELEPARRGQPPAGDRRRDARRRAGEGVLPDHQHLARRALPRHGRRAATARRHGAPRPRSRGRSRPVRASAASTSSSTRR